MDTIYYTLLDSPVGDFLIAGSETEIHFTGFSTGFQQRNPAPGWIQDEHAIRYALDPLRAYFAGEAIEFEVPVTQPGTPFQQAVWRALQSVKYGQTASYGDIANEVGSPLASRAVGAANRANNIPVLVPCHRIIGANGSLTGFGGGLETKAVLLGLEKEMDQFDLF
ncbi:MAG: methylated-DNA--[protein]-cysteine S-methyltransferase [Gammaproteobacteria bacterium]